MPKISMSSAEVQDHGPVKEWAADMGGYTVNLVRFEQDIDGLRCCACCRPASASARTGATS